jgi:hypothetical protein
MMPRVPEARRYWQDSRSPRYSLLFAVPLLGLYEALVAILPRSETRGIRNGADVLLESFFSFIAGTHGPLLFGAVLVGVGGWLFVRDARVHGWRLRAWLFGAMFTEALILALALGLVVGVVTAQVLGATHLLAMVQVERFDIWTRLMVSLGAGLYEELLFRVLLVSGLFVLARDALHWRPRVAGVFAAVVGALLFSAFHYVGPYGDPFAISSFTFRAIAGLALSAIYLLRGFGIDAWTHALYDLLLLFAR